MTKLFGPPPSKGSWKPGQYIFGPPTSKGDLDQFFGPPASKGNWKQFCRRFFYFFSRAIIMKAGGPLFQSL